MKIVAVDICFTLIKKNTTIDFIEFIFRNNKIFKIKNYFRKVISLFSPEFSRKYLIYQLKWFKREELDNLVEQFFTFYESSFNENVLEEIKKLRENWMKVLLLSASLDIIASFLQKKYSFDAYASSILWFKNWVCTWKLDFDCSFWGKVTWLKKIFKRDYEKIDFSNSFFFSDSYDDIEVFKLFENNYLIVNNNFIDKRFESEKLFDKVKKIYV